ncbi:MAG: ABC-type thiamine/hydroxymethylpyrimidine transport system permease subunit [Candidatus Endobugula sp.]|jgi:ABC-type thiamin/hydroxymethylpyrimidine transport system permease subunit
MLKIIIVLLFIGVVVSLSSGLIFLLKDIESPSKRTVYALGIRISLATLLMATIFYGLYTGQLGSSAPWDIKLTKEQVQQQAGK